MIYCIPAYIRKMGELVDSVCFAVTAGSESEACNKVRDYYDQRGLTAGINTSSIRAMVEFGSLQGGVI